MSRTAAPDYATDWETQMHRDNAAALEHAIHRDRVCQRLVTVLHGRAEPDNPILAYLVVHYPEAVDLILKKFEKDGLP